MQEVLKQIASLDGVMGTTLFNEQGKVLAHVCPPLIDASQLSTAAMTIMDCVEGLQITQSVHSIELRYAEGRIVIRKLQGAFICVPCAKNVNLSMVNITLNLALKKLEALIPKMSASAAAVAMPGKASAPAGDGMQLRIAHLQKGDASSSFDQLGMIAVSQSTAKHISDFFGRGAKKVKVTTAEGGGGTFPVMVINDLELQYEEALVIGPGIEKKLKVAEGDSVLITIA